MSSSYRDSIRDRTRMRRIYLWRKAAASAVAMLGAAVAQGVGGLLLLIAILIPKSSMLEIAWALIFGVIACYALGAWLFLSAMERSQSLTYCPPVREQIAAPTSDIVLLRGSEHPSVSPLELVRPAARTGAGDAPNELLRARRTDGDGIAG